jgi:hypothetical protein
MLPKRPSTQYLIDALNACETLSANSRRLFVSKLEGFLALTDFKDAYALISKPAAAWQQLQACPTIAHTPANHHLFLSAVCALFKHVPGLTDRLPAARKKWESTRGQNWETIKQRMMDNRPSQRQTDAMVPYEDVIRVRDALPAGDVAKLLLVVYTALPPARGGDYHSVLIYRNRKTPPAEEKGNFLLLPTGAPCKLMLQQFKTAQHYGRIVHTLPEAVCEEIRRSLQRFPRTHLFVSPETGKPFTRSAFSGWAARVLKRLFRRPVTLTMLRHMYVSEIDFNKMTYRQMEALGKQMGHKLETQKQYQWIVDRPESSSQCTCTCDHSSSS